MIDQWGELFEYCVELFVSYIRVSKSKKDTKKTVLYSKKYIMPI